MKAISTNNIFFKNSFTTKTHNIKHQYYSFNFTNTQNKKYIHSVFKKNSNLLNFAQKKNIFFKIQQKNFYQKYIDKFFENLPIKKIENTDEKFHIVKASLVFKDNKYCVIETDKNFIDSILFLQKFVFKPIIFVGVFQMIRYMIKIKFAPFLFYGLVVLYILRLDVGMIRNKNHLIKNINLFDDGKTCEISTMNKSFKTDIKNIRRLQLEEGIYLSKNIQKMHKNYIPMAIDTNLYLIPKISKIHDKELLSAISNGRYIKFEEVIKKENSIDI